MIRLWFLALALFAIAATTCPLCADGEPTGRLAESGIVMPVNDTHVDVLDQKVFIKLPEPRIPPDGQPKPAVIRVEYVLRRERSLPDEKDEPLTIQVGWPASRGIPVGEKGHLFCIPAIKFDGKPVAYNLLSFDDLWYQYEQFWIARIDELLRSKPALRERVLAIRKECQGQGVYSWRPTAAVGELKRWMEQHGLGSESKRMTETIAAGLLGNTDDNARPSDQAYAIQTALTWLDPFYESIDLYETLSERWGHKLLLLDPATEQLVDMESDLLGHDPGFGVFRFPIALELDKEHRLVVQYGQFLGSATGAAGPFRGLLYLMEPAKRWGGWQKTTIEIRVPTGWHQVAIRPPGKKISTTGGYDTYRILMRHRPYEDLWISVDEASPSGRTATE